MMKLPVFFAFVVLLSGAAYPQSSEPRPTFEVADVHGAPPSTTNFFGRGGTLHGSRYEFNNATMVDLITDAYSVDRDKVLGGPAWLEMDRFDVIAKAPAKTAPETLKLMLQSLLADRFKLVAHADTKPLPAYALRVGKHLLMKPAEGSEEPDCKQSIDGLPKGPTDGPIQISSLTLSLSCHNMTIASLLDGLPLQRQAPGGGIIPIVDQTELKGSWNFDFKFTLGGMGDSIAAVSAEVEKQLGVKLDPITIPLPVVQVQSVNPKPTPNGPETASAFPPLPTEFDVAEIKPSQSGANSGPMMINGGMVMVATKAGGGRNGGGRVPPIQNGRVNLAGYTLKNLIRLAWNINSDDKLAGVPKFADSDKYDVIAKVPAGAADAFSDMDSIRPLLRALLIDRFKMVVHDEERPVPTFVLSSVKPKMKPADPAARTKFYEGPGPDGKDPRTANPAVSRLVTCQNMTMTQFASLLNSIAGGYIGGQPVLNETGLDGAWDFTLNFSVAGMVGGGRGMVVFRSGGGDAGPGGGANTASDPSGGLSLNDALTKQLGLKLETLKRPAPVVVIDRMEQKPAEN
jgi:uncharacterized protein (TIGR03435 family)